jgi:hypothetical protein
MTSRPSKSKSKNFCAHQHSSSQTTNFTIIGDTAASILYAYRLIKNGIKTNKIYVINEGTDRTNFDNIKNTDFVQINAKTIINFLKAERVHLIPRGDHLDQDDDDDFRDDEILFNYFVPSGPLGDFISAYIIPRVGPWFHHAVQSHFMKFINNYATKIPLSNFESSLVNTLANMWNLNKTNDIIVNTPSILTTHYMFLRELNSKYVRKLFLDVYQLVSQEENVEIVTEAKSISFTEVSTGIFNITVNNDLQIENSKLIWRTNPYTFLRISSQGGINPSPIFKPVFYRSVIPIALTSPLSQETDYGDLVTTHLTFSLYELINPKNSSLCWLVQCYTTTEDFAVTDPNGRYSDQGKIFLITEAISTKHRRRLIDNKEENKVHEFYSQRLVEQKFLYQFAQIVAGVYFAYTGVTITPDSLLSTSSICTTSGSCTDNNQVEDFARRESPLETITLLASQLYNMNIYPSFWKC